MMLFHTLSMLYWPGLLDVVPAVVVSRGLRNLFLGPFGSAGPCKDPGIALPNHDNLVILL